jgi:competence protein ComEC
LEHGNFRLLLPIGLDTEAEAMQLSAGLAESATAVLLADHGADSASSQEWLRAVDPQLAVIAVSGTGPSADVLARLSGRNVLRTDERGAVTLLSDGARLWVEVER